MKNKRIKQKKIFALLFATLFVVFSCKDDQENIGKELFPNEQKVILKNDSSRVLHAYTYQSENFISATRSMSNILLGYSNDPVLGTMQCDLITHISLSDPVKTPFSDKEAKVEVDSCVLYLEFYYSEGDTTKEQSFTVFELSPNANIADLEKKELYNHTLNDYFDPSKPLATFTYQLRKTWNDTKNKKRYTPVPFHLPKEFGQRLLTYYKVENGDTILPYKKDSLFRKHILNGFYLKSNPDKNSRGFSVLSKGTEDTKIKDSTRVQVYYKLHKKDTTESLSYVYDIASQIKANIFHNEFNKSLVYNKMYTSLSMAQTNSSIYLKDNNALYSRILVESIGSWADSGTVAINKAAVNLPVEKRIGNDTIFEPIQAIYVYYKKNKNYYPLQMHTDSEGKILPITYNKEKNNYEIILTREIQQLYKEKKWDTPIELLIKSATNSTSARSSIINSPIHETNPMKLILTYTKY